MIPGNAELTTDRLRELLDYDPETGIFRWLVDRTGGTKAGDVAGCKNKDGYIVIRVLGRMYPAHRLAWFYQFGEWTLVDHKDCDGFNNRELNLRKATHQQNTWNRRKRFGKYLKGVNYIAKDRLWIATIRKSGKTQFLGCFKSEAEAHAAYVEAANRMFGEFARAA